MRREDENRHVVAAVAQRAQHGLPGQLREAEVQNHQVVVTAGGEAQAFLAVSDEIGMVPRFFEAALDVLSNGRVILDDQDFH